MRYSVGIIKPRVSIYFKIKSLPSSQQN